MKTTPYTLSPKVIDLLLDAVCVVDTEGHFVYASAACERIFGYTPQEMLGKTMIDMVHPGDRERTLAMAAQIMAGQHLPYFENRYLRKDGQTVHIMWSARWSEADQVRIAVAHDISLRKQAESMQAALYAISEAAHAAPDLASLLQHIHQIIGELLPALNFSIALYDAHSDQLSFPYHIDRNAPGPAERKPAAGTLCAEVIRNGQPLLLTADTLHQIPERLHALINKQSHCWLGVPLKTQNGTIGVLVLESDITETHYTEKDKDLLQFISTQIATTIERQQLHARLQYMAQYDALTCLPNRALLLDRLKTALARARREHERFSLLYLDLDKFKHINDTHGHGVGDLLLQEVARRLRQCVREADTVARIGGDEFVVLLSDIQQHEHATLVADKILSSLDLPLELHGTTLRIRPSIGVAHYPEHGDEEQQLLRHADEAMYHVKKHREHLVVANVEPGLS